MRDKYEEATPFLIRLYRDTKKREEFVNAAAHAMPKEAAYYCWEVIDWIVDNDFSLIDDTPRDLKQQDT